MNKRINTMSVSRSCEETALLDENTSNLSYNFGTRRDDERKNLRHSANL